MNDFTKVELEILKRAIAYWVGENAGKVIKNKIQSMIDNYCEHEWVNGTYCIKCDKSPTGESIYCKCEGKWVCDECHFSKKP